MDIKRFEKLGTGDRLFDVLVLVAAATRRPTTQTAAGSTLLFHIIDFYIFTLQILYFIVVKI